METCLISQTNVVKYEASSECFRMHIATSIDYRRKMIICSRWIEISKRLLIYISSCTWLNLIFAAYLLRIIFIHFDHYNIFICSTCSAIKNYVNLVFSVTAPNSYPIQGNTLTGVDETTSITLTRGIPIGRDIYTKVYVCTFWQERFKIILDL
jgi:hypothetical protein